MRLNALFILCCLFSLQVCAQTFKGRVVTENGEAIPFATFYIRELTSGFIADDRGYFQTALSEGSYTCEVSSLGFVQQTVRLQIPPEGLNMELVLSERVYELHEVGITRSSEDPAYAVMRQVISRAPFYEAHVRRYTADVYLKGTGKLEKIPAILKISKDVREMSKKFQGKLFVMEEQRRVTFTAPNVWENEVKAYTNSFPEGLDVKVHTTDINFYKTKVFGKISPLSAGAFSYYRFKLESSYMQGEHLINKIKVIPRKENPDLLSGYLYVVENLWCLSALEYFFNDATGVSLTVKVACNEVKPSTFLSTSIRLNSSMNVMGVKAEASYLSSIKYDELEIFDNPLLVNQTTEQSAQEAPKLTKKQQKNKAKVDALLQKEELNTREAYQLSKLLTKSIREADTAYHKNRYEHRQNVYKEERDSLAGKRDSIFWESLRSIPLRIEEQESYAYKEKLEMQKSEAKRDSASKKSVLGEALQLLTTGKTYRTKNQKGWITLGSLSACVPEFNFVDGLWVGTKLKTGWKLNEQTTLHFIPEVYYASSREEVLFSGELLLNYAPRRLGHLYLKGGRLSADYNSESGESRLINSFSSIWFGRNDVKLYDKRFFTIGNEVEVTNGLLLSTNLLWERRESLENTRHKGWFGVKAKPNTPRHADYRPMPENELLKASVTVKFTPEQYYWMLGGKKYYDNSRYPTLTLFYERAFSHGGSGTLSPSYQHAELSLEQRIDFGMFNRFWWYANVGSFKDGRNMQFADYKHFTTTRLPVTEHSLDKGFSLLDNYERSTGRRWFQANLSWYTPYLLLKQMPFLKTKLFDEALHLRTLMVYKNNPYTEIGYSIGWTEMARIALFAGFDRLKYRSVGVSVSLSLMQIVGN